MKIITILVFVSFINSSALADCEGFKPQPYSCELTIRSLVNFDQVYKETISGLSTNEDDDHIEHAYFRRSLGKFGELFGRIEFTGAYCSPEVPSLYIETRYANGVAFSSQVPFLGREGVADMTVTPSFIESFKLYLHCKF